LLFYTMPIWMAVMAHFFIPGESLSPVRWLGLAVAVAGVVIVLGERLFTETADTGLGWLGDLLCLLGAIGWALLALMIRITPFGEANNQTQLVFQLAVSAMILLPASLLFGPLVRDFAPIMGGVVAFQVIVVVCFGFTAWLWIVRHYPATQMASFIFLTPVFGAGLGVFLLGEALNWRLISALVCVSIGIVLINRK
ncbi:MAG: DMT family transporter, partial [Pseudomonadota bacterium]|nr:DMT family transporter [Pseudomonadota bacterium]